MSFTMNGSERSVAGKITAIFHADNIISQNERIVEINDMDVDHETESATDVDVERQKSESLKEILPALAQLWSIGTDEMVEATEKLADGSRDPKWRIPLGESGILNFYLELLKSHVLTLNLKIHVLRLIGNSCADTDENRARVVEGTYLPFAVAQLKSVSVLPFAIPVLYNICLDYDPAQQQASTSLLTKELIELISSSKFKDAVAFLVYICKLLDLMAAQTSDVEFAPDHTVNVLLKIAADKEFDLDIDDFTAIVNTATSYLKHEKFQKALLTAGAMDRTLAVLTDSYTRFDAPDEEEAKALDQMRTNLNTALADISGLPEFAETCQVTSPLAVSLRRWLSSPQQQLEVCACIMLGNLARSDTACEEFVHTSRIHLPLITIITDSSEPSLLYAALGFLKNLSLPANNKEILGTSGLFDVLPRLWAMDTLQQIQFTSVSLTRQLTIGTFDNVRSVCRRLSQDPDSPAYSRTKLSLLISLFERTDVEPIKMEIARLITSVCRVFNSTGAGNRSPAELETIRIAFFDRHPDVGRPLGFMVSQTKWPVVRSEGWFVFALMARYPEGAKCIGDMLYNVKVFRPLVQLLTGKDPIEDDLTSSSTPASSSQSPPTNSAPDIPDALLDLSPESPEPHAQAAEMARIDRENALVLVSEMLKNRGSEMALMRRTLYEDLLKGGSELVLSYREGGPTWKGGLLPEKEKRLMAGLNLQEIAEQSTAELG